MPYVCKGKTVSLTAWSMLTLLWNLPVSGALRDTANQSPYSFQLSLRFFKAMPRLPLPIRVGIEVETIFHLWSRESPKTTIMFINNPCTSFGLPCQRRAHPLPLSPELELNPLFSVSLIKHQMKSSACNKESCYMKKCLHFFLLKRFITLCSAHTVRGTQELRPTESILQ